MIFQLCRTSDRINGYKKPLDNCIPMQLVRPETRNCRTPEEFDARFSKREGKWLENGTNHRVDARGYITRDIGLVDIWSIEINSLEELMDFKKAVGEELVLTTSWIDNKTPCIEIYDDYRE